MGMPFKSFMAAVYIVHEEGVLLLFDAAREEWLPPSGAIEEHELPEEAAVRIVRQQLHADIEIIGERRLVGERLLLSEPIAMLVQRDVRHELVELCFAAALRTAVHEDVHWIDARWFSDEDLNSEPIPASVRLCAERARSRRLSHD